MLTGGSPYGMFPLAIMNGLIGTFTAPATRGILPKLVGREDIQPANTYLNTTRSTAKIVSPAAAGILAATVGGGSGIALDALSFFLAATCLVHVRRPSHPAASQESLIHQIWEGWTYFVRQPWIGSITAAYG